MNRTIMCDKLTYRCMIEGKTTCPPPLHGGGIKIAKISHENEILSEHGVQLS